MLRFYSGESCHDDISTIVKTECARVVHKEVDKAIYDDIAWTCGWVVYICHKLHLAISPSILHRFSRSQWLRKALEKTFRSVPVTSRGDQ